VGFFSWMFSDTYKKLSKDDQVEWDSRIVSTIHALMACIGGFYGIFFDRLLTKDVIFGKSYLGELVVGNTTAYWIFDFLLIMRYFKKLGEPGIVMHHVVGIVPFALGLRSSELIFYGCFIILTELSTPFVNNRWFIFMICKNNEKANWSQVEIINGLLMWLTFFICRIVMLPYMLYHMYLHREGVMKVNVLTSGFVIFGTVVVTILSYFWFYKISKGIFKKLQQILGKKKR